MNQEIILAAYHGGLGDNMQFSTLPEEFYIQQGKETYIWDKAQFRNPEIYDFVWGSNPFVKGIKTGIWNAGDTPEIGFSNICNCSIMNWEALHNLVPKNKFPKIYYKPQKINGFSNIVLVDITSISVKYDLILLENILKKIEEQNKDMQYVLINFKKKIIEPKLQIFKNKVEVENIFHYYDLMNSCGGFVGLHSGASCMSSAVQEHNPTLKSTCIMTKDGYNYHKNKGLFIFENIKYVIYE